MSVGLDCQQPFSRWWRQHTRSHTTKGWATEGRERERYGRAITQHPTTAIEVKPATALLLLTPFWLLNSWPLDIALAGRKLNLALCKSNRYIYVWKTTHKTSLWLAWSWGSPSTNKTFSREEARSPVNYLSFPVVNLPDSSSRFRYVRVGGIMITGFHESL